ncbi:hypothetical protein IV500_12015 [Paeniglutamicibacter antarcticus]|uniref:Uncharacterized protein n=1 Tax=Arthrobacter terrae TaxID=2935737 RepID=A0A931CPP2_9MICC|nr:hypothetical protein [Arthrobacter terrae]MBG0740105.1 hypothetical protein [Arthrobacter terrae]
MQYKRSAGLFVAGITLFFGGPLLGVVAAALWMYVATANGSSGMAAGYIAVIAFGSLLALLGFCLLVAAAHRALEKIDALPLRAQTRQRENSPSDYR